MLDVPAAVTQISAETIRHYGITSVPDALRLVPGMQVTRISGGFWVINYHGTTAGNPRRMNVLIDGVSVYHPGLAEVDWAHLPVGVEDIERVEVTRAPNSAAYGPNSMLAVINIITKRPADTVGQQATMGLGERGLYRASASTSWQAGGVFTRIAGSVENDPAYSWLDAHNDGHNATSNQRLSWLTDLSLGKAAGDLTLGANLVQGRDQVPFVGSNQGYPDTLTRDTYLFGTYRRDLSEGHELKVRVTNSTNSLKQQWSACVPKVGFLPELFALYQVNHAWPYEIVLGVQPVGADANQQVLIDRAVAAVAALGADAMTDLCGRTDSNLFQARTDLEVTDTVVVSDKLRLVAGLGARRQRASSATYLNGSASQNTWRAFGNAEYRPADAVVINAGAYLEHDRLSGTTLSPRLGLNWRIAPTQSVRLVHSRGTRSPDIVEQQGQITYHLYGAGPSAGSQWTYFANEKGTTGIQSEKIKSTELGYTGVFEQRALIVDAKLFDDRLSSLISQTVDVQGFPPTNAGAVRLSGAEGQVQWRPSRDLDVFAGAAYLLNTGATTPLERAQYARLSGSAGLSQAMGSSSRLSVDYVANGANPMGPNGYGRLNLALQTTQQWASSRVTYLLRFSRLNSTEVTYLRPTALGHSRNDSRYQLYAQVSLSL